MRITWTLTFFRSCRSAAVAALLTLTSGLGPALLLGTGAPTALAQPAAPGPLTRLDIQPSKATVGATVKLTSRDLPANQAIDLSWETVDGGWVIQDYYHFGGKKYTETTTSLGRFTVDPNGLLDTSFVVPQDWGGVHNVVANLDRVPVAQGALDLTQSFEMSPLEGPVGTPISIRVTGLGWQTLESTWVVNWDNNAVGWVSAAGTHGTATAQFRSAGPAGNHEIKVLTGYQGAGYLNFEQAPNAYLPRPGFTFRTTAGPVPDSYIEPYQTQPVPESSGVGGAAFSISPTQGPVLTAARITGSNLPTDQPISVVWQTMVGSRVSGTGFAPRETVIQTFNAASDGTLSEPFTIPDDLGGLHALLLRRGSDELARTYYVMETSIASISSTSGPVGSPISIHLKGVGWTEYDNIYVANYDNAYMGYACGFNSQGDVMINFTAAGAPGPHTIDLYPSLYEGPHDAQLLYRLPQLTYADDHPGNKIPAIRFSYTVTD
jgi:hypothetical protein